LSKIDCLKRLPDCALTLLRIGSRKPKAIGGCFHYFNRQRTEIMQAAEADLARLEHFLNSRYERNPDTVAQFDQIESELAFNLAQHLITRGVASRVPARGKANHLQNEQLMLPT